jgi:hypothetical protein
VDKSAFKRKKFQKLLSFCKKAKELFPKSFIKKLLNLFGALWITILKSFLISFAVLS